MSYLAFFDLDETLISCKSLMDVFQFYCENSGVEEHLKRYKHTMTSIKNMLNLDIDRNEINRFFYQAFKGIAKVDMERLALVWFEKKRQNLDFFHENIVNELKKHQALGATTVIVSGSFNECVKCVADYLNVKHIVCIELEHKNGIYTGEIFGEQTIGKGKRYAVESLIDKNHWSVAGSFAYADHISDLPFLEIAQYPVVVGDDAVLLDHARQHSWKVMDS